MDLSGKNPEEVLRSGRPIEISPRGYSMYPLLVPGFPEERLHIGHSQDREDTEIR